MRGGVDSASNDSRTSRRHIDFQRWKTEICVSTAARQFAASRRLQRRAARLPQAVVQVERHLKGSYTMNAIVPSGKRVIAAQKRTPRHARCAYARMLSAKPDKPYAARHAASAAV